MKPSERDFKVGDVVTWGGRVIAHRVVEVTPKGVYVDARSANGEARFFVSWSGNATSPLVIADFPPDVFQTEKRVHSAWGQA